MRVKVLAKDIEKGVAMSCYNCPIARAVKRAVKHNRVDVGSVLTVGAREYRLPAKAIRFMERFDSYKTVKPIVFTCQAR